MLDHLLDEAYKLLLLASSPHVPGLTMPTRASSCPWRFGPTMRSSQSLESVAPRASMQCTPSLYIRIESSFIFSANNFFLIGQEGRAPTEILLKL
jgi:hypothetical protein